MTQLRLRSRTVICGAISQYNSLRAARAPRPNLALLVTRSRMEGFIVTDYLSRYGEAVREMSGWIANGKLVSREDIVEGLETFSDTLLKLFTGDNFGKLMIKVVH